MQWRLEGDWDAELERAVLFLPFLFLPFLLVG